MSNGQHVACSGGGPDAPLGLPPGGPNYACGALATPVYIIPQSIHVGMSLEPMSCLRVPPWTTLSCVSYLVLSPKKWVLKPFTSFLATLRVLWAWAW